jgi:hypothetical protein
MRRESTMRTRRRLGGRPLQERTCLRIDRLAEKIAVGRVADVEVDRRVQ